MRPDLIVTSAEGQPRLLVEVKTREPVYEGSQSQWPVELRREYGHFECYFLLVTAERMLLFLPGDPAASGRVYAQDSSAVLAGHLTIERFPLAALGELELTAVVRSWLGSAIFKPETVLLADPAQAWLVESGLHAQIYRGYISREQAAAQMHVFVESNFILECAASSRMTRDGISQRLSLAWVSRNSMTGREWPVFGSLGGYLYCGHDR